MTNRKRKEAIPAKHEKTIRNLIDTLESQDLSYEHVILLKGKIQAYEEIFNIDANDYKKQTEEKNHEPEKNNS